MAAPAMAPPRGGVTRASATFREPALGVGLDPPRDPADEVLAVPASDRLPEHLDVALLEFADHHLLERRKYLLRFSFMRRSHRIVRHTEPRLAGKLKAVFPKLRGFLIIDDSAGKSIVWRLRYHPMALWWPARASPHHP